SGALVFGAIFQSIAQRTKNNPQFQNAPAALRSDRCRKSVNDARRRSARCGLRPVPSAIPEIARWQWPRLGGGVEPTVNG
ncbi:hypothetical protein P3G55_24925, partial [Leptospira sp. 96542]|nr:hypothetical protein [Leptospira sp. 96542]